MSEYTPQRRDKRYRTRLPVRTRIGGRLYALFTEDVSYRGLFVHTESPPPVRQLLRLETTLPPNNIPFATHGMVVYVIGNDDSSGRAPGIGVQFYGMGDERRVWENFIQFIQWRSELVPDRRTGQLDALSIPQPRPAATGTMVAQPARLATVVPSPPPSSGRSGRATTGTDDLLPFRVAIGSGTHENRRFHRFPIVLEVWPRNLDDLLRMYSRDVSVGGMFLPTAREIPLASELSLEIRHPHAKAAFLITAVVRRRSVQPLGIGVEFVELDDRRRRQFFEFIHAPVPVAEELDVELVDGD